MALARHCADYYKKGFRHRCYNQNIWHHLLTAKATGPIRGCYFDGTGYIVVQKPNMELKAT